MKLQLSLLLVSVCVLSPQTISPEACVIQTPEMSGTEGGSVNISCCCTKRFISATWMKVYNGSQNPVMISRPSPTHRTNCTFLLLANIAREDSGTYICSVTVETPVITTLNGSGTRVTVAARSNSTQIPAKDLKNASVSAVYSSVASLLLLLALVYVCVLRWRKARAALVIHEVPHTSSEGAEVDKHSTSSSRGSSQWCQVPVYESFDYFERVETKQ